jgi:hypothetical protein
VQVFTINSLLQKDIKKLNEQHTYPTLLAIGMLDLGDF